MNLRKKLGALALAAIGVAFAGSSAHAKSIELTFEGAVTSGGTTTYSYDATLSQGNEIVAGQSFFQIFDFYGLTGGSGPSNWTFAAVSVQAPAPQVGVLPGLPDSPSVNNAVFDYTGSTVNSLAGPIDLGTFKVTSTVAGLSIGQYNGNDLNNVGTVGTPIFVPSDNFGSVIVPAPLSASAWGGIGLLSILGLARLKRMYSVSA